jgi:hypothetical protein
MRVLWMASELSLEYEHVPYEFNDPKLKQPPGALGAKGLVVNRPD